MALANLVALVPAAPGYVGTFDAAIILGVRLVAGGTQAAALAYAVIVRFTLFVPITLVGLAALIIRYGGIARLRAALAGGVAEPHGSGRALGPRRLVVLGARAAGQLDRQRAARTSRPGRRPSVRPSVAAHPLGELAADGQAEAEAALARRRAAALEALEDPLAILAAHAGAVVGDRDVRVVAVVLGAHDDRRVLGRVAQRVVDEDAHDPGDGVGVAAAPAGAGRPRDVEVDAPGGRAQLELGADRAAQLAELDGLASAAGRRRRGG